jgi:hypothetical protein
MTNSEELPIPGYDGLSAGEIEHRIRSLTPQDLDQVLRHERAHADRARVTQLIRARQKELDTGATLSPGGQAPPGRPGPARGTSAVGPGTSAEPFSAPPHGTPHQSGKPKGDQRRP